MYINAWQEYRVSQLLNEQHRLLSQAVKEQIRHQLLEEHTRAPQVQLPIANERGRRVDSYSAALKAIQPQSQSQQQYSYAHVQSILSTNRSTASSASFTSAHSHTSSAVSMYSQLPTPTHVSVASTPISSHRPLIVDNRSSSVVSLPPIDAAAHAAVQAMQAQRLRATYRHPLAHVVSTYLPASAVAALDSTVTTANTTERSASRASERSARSEPPLSFGGGGVTWQTLQQSVPAPKRRRPIRNAAAEQKKAAAAAAQAHRQHIQKLRALYGLAANQSVDATNNTGENGAHHSVAPPNAQSTHAIAAVNAVSAPHTHTASTVTLPPLPIPHHNNHLHNGVSPLTQHPPLHNSHSHAHAAPLKPHLSTSTTNTSSYSRLRTPLHAATNGVPSSSSRSSSRLQTPQHASRPQLHSSSGLSDSGDFETQVDDMLEWVNQAAKEISPKSAKQAEVMEFR